jgi:ribosome biogenesis GTPase A
VAKLKAYENPVYDTPISKLEQTSTFVDAASFYEQSSIAIPSRPLWTADMTKRDLDQSEQKYFQEWLDSVYQTCHSDHLGFFEQNLEVWRQFWRVCEISDVIIIVLDVRFPILHYPLSLHNYLVKKLRLPFVIALMKCDLVDQALTDTWKNVIRGYFGDEANICEISIYPLSINGGSAPIGRKRYQNATGVNELLKLCRNLTGSRYSTEWDGLTKVPEGERDISELTPSKNVEYVTIGTLGHPNVGKSSLINSIVGRKVVSASKTPGHTKHFQTIHLSKHIRLCDCPGLIFPVALSRDIQILNGLYNVAQVRDPFGPLAVACGMINLPGALRLCLPEDNGHWTILLICERFAIERGFYTAKAGRPDLQRAANLILRMILDGRVLIAWRPIDYNGPIARSTSVDTTSSEESTDCQSELDESEQGTAQNSNPFASLSEE